MWLLDEDDAPSHAKIGDFIKDELSVSLEEMNEIMAVCRRVKFEIRQEYTVEYVKYILDTFLESTGMRTEDMEPCCG